MSPLPFFNFDVIVPLKTSVTNFKDILKYIAKEMNCAFLKIFAKSLKFRVAKYREVNLWLKFLVISREIACD